MNLFVFDIETVPDVDAGRRLYDLDDQTLERYGEAADTLIDELGLRHQEPWTAEEAAVSEGADQNNLVGIGLGEKEVSGISQGVAALRFYVVRKFDPESVKQKASGLKRQFQE